MGEQPVELVHKAGNLLRVEVFVKRTVEIGVEGGLIPQEGILELPREVRYTVIVVIISLILVQ